MFRMDTPFFNAILFKCIFPFEFPISHNEIDLDSRANYTSALFHLAISDPDLTNGKYCFHRALRIAIAPLVLPTDMHTIFCQGRAPGFVISHFCAAMVGNSIKAERENTFCPNIGSTICKAAIFILTC